MKQLFFLSAILCCSQLLMAQTDVNLTASEKSFLDSLCDHVLPSSKDRVYAQIKVTRNNAWGYKAVAKRQGWYDKSENTIWFNDGTSQLVNSEDSLTTTKFEDAFRLKYRNGELPFNGNDETFANMTTWALGLYRDHDLFVAAWAYQRGDEQLARMALDKSNPANRSFSEVKKWAFFNLEWSLYAQAVHSYMVREDERAMEALKLLRKKFPKPSYYYGTPAEIIYQDLKGRIKAAGKSSYADTIPTGFHNWSDREKTSFLIDQLDEVDARQWGQPGGVSFFSDWRVKHLVKVGEPAIEALLNVIESDKRLTRSVHFHRDFKTSRTVIEVAEVALTVAMSIMQVEAFHPRATGDNFSSQSPETKQEKVDYLRDYWREYGHIPYDERMMMVLKDSTNNLDQREEAAKNLVFLNHRKFIGSTVWSNDWVSHQDQQNTAVQKFRNPSVAEVLFNLLDARLAENDADLSGLHDYTQRTIYNRYTSWLIELKDSAVLNEVIRRYEKHGFSNIGRYWAFTAHFLGDSEPINAYAKQVESGKIAVPEWNGNIAEEDEKSIVLVRDVIYRLGTVNTFECRQALEAIKSETHPFHHTWKEQVLDPPFWNKEIWFSTDFCLSILIERLTNTASSGQTYQWDGEYIKGGGYSTTGYYDSVTLSNFKDRVETQIRDEAALKLSDLIIGLPQFHPLMEKRDAILKEYVEFFSDLKQFTKLSPTLRDSAGIEDPDFGYQYYPSSQQELVTWMKHKELIAQDFDLEEESNSSRRASADVIKNIGLVVGTATNFQGQQCYIGITGRNIKLVPITP